MELNRLKFPIGVFEFDPKISIKVSISKIESLPDRIGALLEKTQQYQLEWAYRPQGWKICQLVHHIADSHVNAYIRTRMAYSNPGCSITPYDEKLWSNFPDSTSTDVANSVKIIFSIHQRWVTFLKEIRENELEFTYFHPVDNEQVSLRKAIQMYAWHGDHHFAHLVQGLESKGKY